MRVVMIGMIGLGLVGCGEPNIPGFDGTKMNEYFSLDGVRTWDFVSDDTTLPYKMHGVLNTEPDVKADGRSVYAIDFTKVCLSESDACVADSPVMSLSLSVDMQAGVHLWAFSADGVDVKTFDPPVQLAPAQMLIETSATTETGGNTWTSTFVSRIDCAIPWAEWTEPCPRLVVDDGGANSGFNGELTVAAGWNIVGFAFDADGARWALDYASFDVLN